MFKGAIFDMDGTILDSMGMWRDITCKFMSDRNLTVTEEELMSYREMTMEESMPFIKEKYNLLESVEEMKNEFNRLGHNAYMYEVEAKPGIQEYFKKLKSEGVKIAIATSSYKDLCIGSMKRLGLYDMIDAIALSCEVGVNKSNPDIYLLAAKRLGILPKDCMVFEDILMGIRGAKKGGMQTTAISDFSNIDDREKLKMEADRYIDSWEELL